MPKKLQFRKEYFALEEMKLPIPKNKLQTKDIKIIKLKLSKINGIIRVDYWIKLTQPKQWSVKINA